MTSLSGELSDHSSSADSSVYPHYDIVMWSQTHWRWLETKLVELGILGGDTQYKVSDIVLRLELQARLTPNFPRRLGPARAAHILGWEGVLVIFPLLPCGEEGSEGRVVEWRGAHWIAAGADSNTTGPAAAADSQ